MRGLGKNTENNKNMDSREIPCNETHQLFDKDPDEI